MTPKGQSMLVLFVSEGQGPRCSLPLEDRIRGLLRDKLQWAEARTELSEDASISPCFCVRQVPELWPEGDVIRVQLQGNESTFSIAITELEAAGLQVHRGDDQVRTHSKKA